MASSKPSRNCEWSCTRNSNRILFAVSLFVPLVSSDLKTSHSPVAGRGPISHLDQSLST